MKPFLRDVLITARHELADAVRSKRVAVVLALYVAAAVLTCYGFISALHRIETELSATLQLPASTTAGTVTEALWKSSAFRRMIIQLVGDKQVALELLSIPPMALIFGWMAFTFTPLLVIMSATPRISDELRAGSARFVLTRSSRIGWCIGKYLGQALELILALCLSAVAAWCVVRFRTSSAGNPQLISAMILYAWKVWLYSLSFIGLSLGISQLTRSPHLATALGLIAWVIMGVLSKVSSHYVGDGVRQLWQLGIILVPMGHRLDLWRTDLAHVVQASVYLLALGSAYFLGGYAFFRRRDL